MAKYKIGDRFEFPGGVREIVGVYERGGDVYYWIDQERENLYTLSEWYVDDNYTKIEPFFEVDKKYTIHGVIVYTIYAVSGEGDDRVALARYDGSNWAVFNLEDFRAMREVQ